MLSVLHLMQGLTGGQTPIVVEMSPKLLNVASRVGISESSTPPKEPGPGAVPPLTRETPECTAMATVFIHILQFSLFQ